MRDQQWPLDALHQGEELAEVELSGDGEAKRFQCACFGLALEFEIEKLVSAKPPTAKRPGERGCGA